MAFLVFAIFTLVMSMHAPVKSMSDLRARHHGRDGHPHHARHGVHSREQDSSEERDDDDDSREKLDRDARDHHMRGKPMHSGSMHGKPVHGKPMHGKPMHGMSWEQMMKMKELFRKECKNRKWGKEGKGHWDEWLKKQMAAKVAVGGFAHLFVLIYKTPFVRICLRFYSLTILRRIHTPFRKISFANYIILLLFCSSWKNHVGFFLQMSSPTLVTAIGCIICWPN